MRRTPRSEPGNRTNPLRRGIAGSQSTTDTGGGRRRDASHHLERVQMDCLNLRGPEGIAFDLTSDYCVFCRGCATHSLLPVASSDFKHSTLCCLCMLILQDLALRTETLVDADLRPLESARNQPDAVEFMAIEVRPTNGTEGMACLFCEQDGKFSLWRPVTSVVPTLFCQHCMHSFLRLHGMLTGSNGPAEDFLAMLEEQSAVDAIEELLGLPDSAEWRAA